MKHKSRKKLWIKVGGFLGHKLPFFDDGNDFVRSHGAQQKCGIPFDRFFHRVKFVHRMRIENKFLAVDILLRKATYLSKNLFFDDIRRKITRMQITYGVLERSDSEIPRVLWQFNYGDNLSIGF